ncbi:MAG: TetR family transcriptional regulator [Pseudomonadota bacterium]
MVTLPISVVSGKRHAEAEVKIIEQIATTETGQADSGQRVGTGTRARGQAKIQLILQAAIAHIMECGASQFSMNAIASRAKLRISAIQYYFPTRADLLGAIFADTSRRYSDEFQKLRERWPDEPTARFTAVIDFLFDDAVDPQRRAFFVHLWSIAASEGLESALSDIYAYYRKQVATLIAEVNPALSNRKAEQRAQLVNAAIEGALVVVFPGQHSKRYLADFKKLLLANALAVVNAPS